jgi:hypothetical protein
VFGTLSISIADAVYAVHISDSRISCSYEYPNHNKLDEQLTLIRYIFLSHDTLPTIVDELLRLLYQLGLYHGFIVSSFVVLPTRPEHGCSGEINRINRMDKIIKMICFATLAIFGFCLATGAQAGGGMDVSMIQELRKLIEQQQKQLDRQGAEIAKLKEQLGGAAQHVEQKVDKAELEELDVEKMVTSRFKYVDVNLYGHLNKGILWSENGDSSKVFFVDNSNSQSRIGINASVVPSDDLTVGGKIEYGIKSNASADVSQTDTNDATSVNWNLRHADIFFNSKTFGKISIGHGSTASDGTAEIDLSGTSVVSYSDMPAISGGQYFYDSVTYTLTDIQVKNVYTNMDGLGRDDRFRYDTPYYSGFTLSSSAVSGDAYDAAIRYSRIYGETKVAAAVAWAKPADSKLSVKHQYDGSMSLLFATG